MGMGFGRALAALGGGFTGWADDMAKVREKRADRDAELAARGIFPVQQQAGAPAQSPRDVLAQVPVAKMERVTPVRPDPMLAAVAIGGMGRSIVPGMRPEPPSLSPSLEMDSAPPPEIQRPNPQVVADALRGTQRPRMTLGDAEYEVRPEMTPEGRRDALQRATREPGNRQAFGFLAQNMEGIGDYNPDVDYTAMQQTVGTSALRARERQVDPAQNRAAYDSIPAEAFPGGHKPSFVTGDNWVSARQRYLNGEMGQKNTIETRVMFPPQGSTGELTATQQRAEARRQAEAAMRVRVRSLGLGGGIVPEDYKRIQTQYGGNIVSQAELIDIATDEFHRMEGESRTAGSADRAVTRFSERPRRKTFAEIEAELNRNRH